MHAQAQPVIRGPALAETVEVFTPPSVITYRDDDPVASAIAAAIEAAQRTHQLDHPTYEVVLAKPLSGLTGDELERAVLIISAGQPGVSSDVSKKQFIAGGTKKAPTYDGPGATARELIFVRSDVKPTAADSIAAKVAPRLTWDYRQTLRERRQQSGGVQHQVVETAAQAVVAALNAGPELRGSMASIRYADGLPRHQRFSWALVPDAAIQVDRRSVERIEGALVNLQRAVSKLAQSEPEVRLRLSQGVALNDPELLDAYLNPPVDHYDLTARSDLHYSGGRLVVGEIDEMPGGEGLTYLVDSVYGVNQDAWRHRFDALSSAGPVLWVLADWSAVYEAELRWFVAEAQKLGYPFRIATKRELSEIQVDDAGVTFRGERIGRVRRLFAIWEPETFPVLKELVLAARREVVSLDQPYGWFGNKALFAIFFEYESQLRQLLGSKTYDLLQASIPETRFISHDEDPRSFQNDTRAVMKIIGANDRAARSYGVQLFRSLSAVKRVEWMMEHRDTPLIRQECFDYDRVPLAAFDTRSELPMVFQKGRLMVRPWRTGSDLTAGLAMVGEEYKVHGGVGTATVSTLFVD
jgi:hypothetical protein